MLDTVFAAIGMLGGIAFMGVVTVFVMEPDLWALREAVGTGTDDELPDLPVIAFPAALAIDGIGARLARPRVLARRQDPLDPRDPAKRLLPQGAGRRPFGPGPERGKDYH